MSKVNKITRVYLTIKVDEPYRYRNTWDWSTLAREKADELRKLIRAANINGLGGVDYEVESPTVCSLCGLDWEEDSDGAPMCCDAAVSEWEEQNAKKPLDSAPEQPNL